MNHSTRAFKETEFNQTQLLVNNVEVALIKFVDGNKFFHIDHRMTPYKNPMSCIKIECNGSYEDMTEQATRFLNNESVTFYA